MKSLPLALLALLLATLPAIAQTPVLDLSYGDEGEAWPYYGANFQFLTQVLSAPAPDGSVINVTFGIQPGPTNWTMRRFDAQGVGDPAYAESGGYLRIPFPDFGSSPSDLVVDPSGSAVMVGRLTVDGQDTPFAFRALPDGTPDPRFESGAFAVGFPARATSVVPLLGTYVVGITATDGRCGVARLDARGRLDARFGVGGLVMVQASALGCTVSDVAVDARRRILVSATAETPDGPQAAAVRLLANGSFDPSFGEKGFLIPFPTLRSRADAVGVDEQGRVFLAGFTFGNGDANRVFVLREDGDDVGGPSRWRRTQLETNLKTEVPVRLAIDADGAPAILFAKWVPLGADFVVMRFRRLANDRLQDLYAMTIASTPGTPDSPLPTSYTDNPFIELLDNGDVLAGMHSEGPGDLGVPRLYRYTAPAPVAGEISNGQTSTQVEAPRPLSVSLTPNPSVMEATVSVVLPEPDLLRIEVFDAIGRHVDTLSDGTAPAGETRIHWNAAARPQGVYAIRVRTSTDSRTVMATVAR